MKDVKKGARGGKFEFLLDRGQIILVCLSFTYTYQITQPFFDNGFLVTMMAYSCDKVNSILLTKGQVRNVLVEFYLENLNEFSSNCEQHCDPMILVMLTRVWTWGKVHHPPLICLLACPHSFLCSTVSINLSSSQRRVLSQAESTVRSLHSFSSACLKLGSICNLLPKYIEIEKVSVRFRFPIFVLLSKKEWKIFASYNP